MIYIVDRNVKIIGDTSESLMDMCIFRNINISNTKIQIGSIVVLGFIVANIPKFSRSNLALDNFRATV